MNKKQSSSVCRLSSAGFICLGLDGPPINSPIRQEIFMQKKSKIVMVDLVGKIYMVDPIMIKSTPPVDIYNLMDSFEDVTESK